MLILQKSWHTEPTKQFIPWQACFIWINIHYPVCSPKLETKCGHNWFLLEAFLFYIVPKSDFFKKESVYLVKIAFIEMVWFLDEILSINTRKMDNHEKHRGCILGCKPHRICLRPILKSPETIKIIIYLHKKHGERLEIHDVTHPFIYLKSIIL